MIALNSHEIRKKHNYVEELEKINIGKAIKISGASFQQMRSIVAGIKYHIDYHRLNFWVKYEYDRKEKIIYVTKTESKSGSESD